LNPEMIQSLFSNSNPGRAESWHPRCPGQWVLRDLRVPLRTLRLKIFVSIHRAVRKRAIP
jgi:hypothetical protein